MYLDRSLKVALTVSTLFHMAIFLPVAGFSSLRIRKEKPALVVTYLMPEEVTVTASNVKEQPIAQLKPQVNKQTQQLQLKTDSSETTKDKLTKKVDSPASNSQQSAQILIPPELTKEEGQFYLNYYDTVRERIRQLVIENYPHYIACGEVCLYFILSANGELKEIRIVEEKSSRNRLLKEIASKSVRQAAPFLAFPKELTQQQLSFNVVISFELEQ